MAEAVNADRLNEIRERHVRADCERFEGISGTPCVPCDLLAALDAAEQRAAQAESLAQQIRNRAERADVRAAQAEQERDKWQELATRLAEEAGVDAEAMLAQARAALTTHPSVTPEPRTDSA